MRYVAHIIVLILTCSCMSNIAIAAPPTNLQGGAVMTPQASSPIPAGKYGFYVRSTDKHFLYSNAGTVVDMNSFLVCSVCGNFSPVYFNTTTGQLNSSGLVFTPTVGGNYEGLTSSDGIMSMRLVTGDSASLAYNWSQATSNAISIDMLGVHIIRNGTLIAEYVGLGTGRKFSVSATIESTSGGIKFPDGTTQTTAATGGGSGVPANTLWYDPTQYAVFDDASCTGGYTHPWYAHYNATDKNVAVETVMLAGGTATGVHFYYSGTTSVTATCRLWVNGGPPTTVATGTVAVAARGRYVCTFATPFTVTKGTPYFWSVYTPGGFTDVASCDGGAGTVPNQPNAGDIQGGPNIVYVNWMKESTSGDGPPTSTGVNVKPIGPEFTIP